jgi:hypothetical protein
MAMEGGTLIPTARKTSIIFHAACLFARMWRCRRRVSIWPIFAHRRGRGGGRNAPGDFVVDGKLAAEDPSLCVHSLVDALQPNQALCWLSRKTACR